MITTLKGQNFRDTCGRVKAVLRQRLDENQPKSPIPDESLYEACFGVIIELERENKRLRGSLLKGGEKRG